MSKNMPPCMNCLLIEMGEMACYQERCPECGRIPPGRKAVPGKKFKTFVGRTLSAKNAGTPNGSVGMEGHLRTNQPPFKNNFSHPQNGRGHFATQINHSSEVNVPNGDKNIHYNALHGSRQLQEDSMA
jgi:hypothetical protein